MEKVWQESKNGKNDVSEIACNNILMYLDKVAEYNVLIRSYIPQLSTIESRDEVTYALEERILRYSAIISEIRVKQKEWRRRS